ncbi:MAG TPA: hypothetical protein VH188_07365 [Chthoniobacterales bacterium]|jgi:hypothetical protein|nr:hypothetical protein [Chthoniobacterales bacterium]
MMHPAPNARETILKWLQPLILALPSAWLLLTIHPFWRDSDAYIQVTMPPGPVTILLYSPIYCFGARVPLYLGCAYEALMGGGSLPSLGFFKSPILTDSGVLLLIALQHAFLLGAQLFLLRSIVATNLTRSIFAVGLASIAPFYTYNHCVGVEALSVSSSLLLIGVVLRIARRRRVKRSEWLWFGLSLALCILMRRVNTVLAALLPTMFLLQALALATQGYFHRSRARFPRRTIQRGLGLCGLSLVVAFLSVAVAERSSRYACRAAKIKYRSMVGPTFVWRLNFLANLDEDERAALLSRLETRTTDPAVQRMIAATPAGILAPREWDPGPLINRSIEIMEQSGIKTDYAYHLDFYTNRLASVFLRSFEPPFLRAVRADFISSFNYSVRDLATYPILTTRYSLAKISEMPQLAKLATFRGNSADTTLRAQEQLIYFRLIDLRFRNLLIVWAILIAVALVVKTGRSIIIPSMVLVATGVMMVLLTCSLTYLLPRFVLPFWVCYVAAVLLPLGSIVDAIGRRRLRLQGAPGRTSWNS